MDSVDFRTAVASFVSNRTDMSVVSNRTVDSVVFSEADVSAVSGCTTRCEVCRKASLLPISELVMGSIDSRIRETGASSGSGD